MWSYDFYDMALATEKQRSHMSLVSRKPGFGVSDQVRLKPACSATEATWSLEILDIASIGIIAHRYGDELYDRKRSQEANPFFTHNASLILGMCAHGHRQLPAFDI